MYRGSRKHVLDWTEQHSFLPELLHLAEPATPRVSSESQWMPRGYRESDEARLETFGPRCMPGSSAWDQLRQWWLKHEGMSNTPNWDIALSCELEGRPGLILVEAKAHKKELKTDGKQLERNASERSWANHEQIGAAIAEACHGLRNIESSISIARDSHYQLANRLAFTWKLATLGVPTALIYLGFCGDAGIRDVGPPLQDDDDWRRTFQSHVAGTKAETLLERRLDCGGAAAWILLRSRGIVEVSPPSAGATNEIQNDEDN